MDNKFNAVVEYRGLVSKLIHDLLSVQGGQTLTSIATLLHLTIGQTSRVYHGVCSLSPEKFLMLYQFHTSRFSQATTFRIFNEVVTWFDGRTL